MKLTSRHTLHALFSAGIGALPVAAAAFALVIAIAWSSAMTIDVDAQSGVGPAVTRIVLFPVEDTAVKIPFDGVLIEDDPESPTLSVFVTDLDPRDGVALVLFDISGLPTDHEPYRATLRMHLASVNALPGQPRRGASAAQIDSAWSAGSLGGHALPAKLGGGAYADVAHIPHWVEWDLSDVVESWRGEQPNHGVMISIPHAVSDHLSFHFASMESDRRPQLVITNADEAAIFLPLVR